MKKLILMLMASLLLASSAFAVVDPDINSVGIYGDLNADITNVESAPFTPVAMYLVLTNPDFPELYGFELGYDIVGNALVTTTTFANPQALDVGGAANHIVGFGAPTPCTEATLLATLSVLPMDASPVGFVLTGTVPSSANPMLPTLLAADGNLIPGGDSTDIGNVNFAINGDNVVATEDASFDSVKSLYR